MRKENGTHIEHGAPTWAMSPQRDFRTRHDGFVLTDQGRKSRQCFCHDAALIVDALDDLGWRPIVEFGNLYRGAARDLAEGARAPLESWQALRDAVRGTDEDGADALAETTAAAERLETSLGDAGRAATDAGVAAGAAAAVAEPATDAAVTGWRAVTAALSDYASKAREIGGDIGQSLVGAFQSAETAVGQFVKTGKLDFRDLVTSLLADLAQLAARRFILGPIANALSGVFSGAGGIFANVLHAGGMVGSAGPSRMVPAMAFAAAPRMHGGGMAGLRHDEVPAILQRGERVLSRREAQSYGAGGGVNVTIMARDAESFRQSRTQVGALVSDFYPGPTSRFDHGNALVVDLLTGTLESVTDLTLLGGANALAIESAPGTWEIVQAGAAELLAPGRYRLTRLLRGQRGTEGAMGNPAPAGALVVVLDASLASLPIAEADLGLPWNWRIGPASRPVSDETYVAQSFTPAGVGLRPFSGAHVEQPWRRPRTPGDLTIRWTRRSRALAADSWGGLEVPLGEELEAYEVEILDGATVKRVLSTATTSAVYTAADQTADWGAPLGPGDTLDSRIYQLSALVGRGAPKTLTLIL
jgi:hypothetical protein